MNKNDSLEVRSPVRVRVTFDGEDGGSATRSVHCRKRGRSVPYGMCAVCSDALALPVHPADGDAEVRCSADTLSPSSMADLAESAARTSIGEILHRRVACVRKETSWDTLEGLLLDEDVGAIPVVDAHSRPIGIISKTDLLRQRRDSGEGEAGEVMSPLAHVLSERAPLSFALAALAISDTTHIPVVTDSGEVVGVLSARNAVRWIAQRLGYVVPPPEG